MKMYCFSNGLYWLKNCHNPFGKGFHFNMGLPSYWLEYFHAVDINIASIFGSIYARWLNVVVNIGGCGAFLRDDIWRLAPVACNAFPDLVNDLPRGPPKTYHNHNDCTAKIITIKISITIIALTKTYHNHNDCIAKIIKINISIIIIAHLKTYHNQNDCTAKIVTVKIPVKT